MCGGAEGWGGGLWSGLLCSLEEEVMYQTVKKYWYGRQDEESRKSCTYHTMISDGDNLGFRSGLLIPSRNENKWRSSGPFCMFLLFLLVIAYISCFVLYGEVKWNGNGKGRENILPSYLHIVFSRNSLVRTCS